MKPDQDADEGDASVPTSTSWTVSVRIVGHPARPGGQRPRAVRVGRHVAGRPSEDVEAEIAGVARSRERAVEADDVAEPVIRHGRRPPHRAGAGDVARAFLDDGREQGVGGARRAVGDILDGLVGSTRAGERSGASDSLMGSGDARPDLDELIDVLTGERGEEGLSGAKTLRSCGIDSPAAGAGSGVIELTNIAESGRRHDQS